MTKKKKKTAGTSFTLYKRKVNSERYRRIHTTSFLLIQKSTNFNIQNAAEFYRTLCKVQTFHNNKRQTVNSNMGK